MRKLVISEFVTLDGVMQDPGGAEKDEFDRGGWAFQFQRGEVGDKYKFDELMAADVLLLGRKTYEGFAKAWPNYKDDVGFAEKMNTMPKYVVSSTMQSGDWGPTTIIKDDVPGAVKALKQESGGDILVGGSAQLTATLIEHDLVDEYRLMIHPVVLGTGTRLFRDTGKAAKLAIVEATQAEEVAILTLRSS
jgi:dihydrofolate reductase